MNRPLSYAEAIREAHFQLLKFDPRVFVIGQGLWSPWYVGSTMTDLDLQFGRNRIIDTPVSENATTAAAVGAALCGMRPIVVHPRMDFMMLAVDPIVNQAANWSYLFNGKIGVPVVIRSIINRGGEQGAQHSQALHATFSHIPGLKVVMPSTAYDAKGLLIAAVRDGNPVMFIDDRWLYQEVSDVPEEMYDVAIGKGIVRREGSDLTIVGLSFAADQALKASEALVDLGIDAEVIDLRSAKPWDRKLVISSVKKTGRLLVVDSGWLTCGFSSEVVAAVTEHAFADLRFPPKRLALRDTPAPSSKPLESLYYLRTPDVISAAKQMFDRKPAAATKCGD